MDVSSQEELVAEYRYSWVGAAVVYAFCWLGLRDLVAAQWGGGSWELVEWHDWGVIWVVLVATVALSIRCRVTEKGLCTTVFGDCGFPRARMQWHEVKRIMDEHFGGGHMFHVITEEGNLVPGAKMVVYSNIFCIRHKRFLKDVVVRVPPTCHVDQSILDRIGFTQDDIGKLYQPPPEAADS